ncbi:WD repeat containing protein [Neofusicoccum parvum]|uniref:WD repeat containing protein n=1 Tax=Neofusicoccum parvum TaxID=310453 RepID=A0ACB5SFQ8_9PEZI|nr:WD repeat containing protein [Neofusicoccum parvum]
MAGPTAVQDAPSTPKDARRKRKAKDSSAGNHDAKRIRTQDEENAAGAPPSGGNQAKAETALAIVGDKAGQLTKAGKNDASKPRKKQHADKSSWYTSEPAGGRFLQIDPIFSRDERFLIFATAKAVHIYSTANSLLVRTLPMNTSHSITAYALSSIDPDHLYVSDASGFVVLWDWMSGKKVNRWNLAAPVRGIATSAVDGPTGEKVETVFTLDKGEHSIIHAHRLRGRKDASESSAQPLLKTRVPLQSFTVAGQGQVIAAAAKDRVFVGQIKNTSTATLKDLIFIWRELSCTQKITSIDVQVKGAEKKTPKKGAPSSTGQVNLVIGCTNGALFLYEDIVAKLSQAEKQQKKDSKEPSAAPSLAPRTLHWHRNPVGTVKWSLDGNYIISGGQETVLVLWQLQTSKKQFLPNLTSAIDGLVVSPSGASYAVQLADNSVIVLSTAELLPKANIAGVQSRFFSLDSTSDNELLDSVRRTAAAVNPQDSNQILLSVPASQPRTEVNGVNPPAPFLQTYDISSNHHVFRQAITRNNATIFNQGPGATKLREPDLRHLQLSHDGKWLATVEEWIPPVEDVEHLAAEKTMIEEERRVRREVYLKFWLWNEEKAQWMLESRIDAPHQFTDKLISGRVFDLKYDPSSTSFATVGEDGFIRIWAPKTRLHDGTVVRGSKGEGLVTWSSRSSIRLEAAVEGLGADSDIPSELVPVNARLAYSPDGSVLAASQEFYGNHSQGLVHFVDPTAGSVRYSRGGLYSTGLVEIAFVGRQFIILSNSLSVWDLVDDELSYGYSFRPLGLTRAQKAEIIHLAINNTDGTFALSLPLPEQQKKASKLESADAPAPTAATQKEPSSTTKKRMSKIFVFSTASPRPLYSVVVPQLVTALLPAGSRKGFVALNTAAELRVIAPKTAGFQLVGPVAAAEESLGAFVDEETALEPLVEDEEDDKVEEKLPTEEELEEGVAAEGDQGDKPVVRPEMLAGVFDVGPSFALPPVRDLFEAVVGLYARKPRAVAAV